MKCKWLSFLLIACCLAGVSACSFGTGGGEGGSSIHGEAGTKAEVEKTAEDMVAIRVLEADGEETLLSVMEDLQEEGLVNFTIQNGMVMGINGKDNPIDFSHCWMLYTSDEEMANAAWGEIEYNGEKLGSAVLGADSLPVLEGEVYVWYYQAF